MHKNQLFHRPVLLVQYYCEHLNINYYTGTGIGGLMRGMATLLQGNQELLVVRDRVGRPQVSFG